MEKLLKLLPGARLEFLAIFLISLQSFYFEAVGFPVFSMIGTMIFSWSVFKHFSFTSVSQNRFIFALWLIGLLALMGSAWHGRINGDGFWSSKTVAGFLWGWSILFIAGSLPVVRYRTAIFFTILIHLFFFYLQLTSAFILGPKEIFDFLSPVTGEPQRTQVVLTGVNNLSHFEWVRPSGLFNEPATYGLFVSSLYGLYCYLEGTRNHRWVYPLVIGSLCFTGSLTAIISSVLLVVTIELMSARGACMPGLIRFRMGTLIATPLLMISVPQLREVVMDAVGRLTRLERDRSFQTRIGRLEPTGPNETTDLPVSQSPKAIPAGSVLGYGLGNYRVLKGAGMGWGYFYSYMGILGALLLPFLLMSLLSLPGVLIMTLFMLSASYVQHPIFWTLLCLVRSTKQQIDAPRQ